MTKTILISSSRQGRIEYKVFDHLHTEFCNIGLPSLFLCTTAKAFGFLRKLFGNFFFVLSAPSVVFHSPLTVSLFPLVLFKILNKKVIAVVWDVYPWHLTKNCHFRKSFGMRVMDIIEPFLLSLCTTVIVPSDDFIKSEHLSSAIVIPFWPREPSPSLPLKARSFVHDSKSVIRIVFAGQLNSTRDIIGAYNKLSSISSFDFELIVFSNDALPQYLRERKNITHCGFVDGITLAKIMNSCDLGLISLSPDFDAPAFPSKVFAYLSAGLPCLYYGPQLNAYTSLLIGCNIGIDITSAQSLHAHDISRLTFGFESSKQLFLDKACLSTYLVNDIINLLPKG